MSDWFRKAGEIWGKADRALGGWLPGGGTASPLMRSRQEGERRLAERVQASLRRQDTFETDRDHVSRPGRFAGEGQVLNPIRAFTEAGANPFGAAFGNKDDIKKAADYYKQYPDAQNQYDLNTNLFLRYLSGTGAEGLKISPQVGRQLYSDIQEQEKKFLATGYREQQINNPQTDTRYIKQNLLAGRTPVYYGGVSDAIAPHPAQLPIDQGERWQLKNSIGSFWANPSDSDPSYTINNERYNFNYAPLSKEGQPFGQDGLILPTSPADIGRRIVKAGYGTPFSYDLNVNSRGNIKVNPQ